MIETDKAWAAGLFEGEGSVRISKPAPRNMGSLLVDVVNTDQALAEFFFREWGGYFKETILPGNRKPAWRWRAAALEAQRFLLIIRPFIKGAKAARIDLALAFQRQKSMTRSNRTAEYRAEQWRFFEAMKLLNERGLPSGAQISMLSSSTKK